MKQKLLFIFALLCAVAQGVQAKNTVHNLSTLAWSGETMILVAEDGDVLTGSIRIDKDHRIKWEIAEGASITLNNVNIECRMCSPCSSAIVTTKGWTTASVKSAFRDFFRKLFVFFYKNLK